jgi:polyhydroxyalkanoate synthase
LNTKSSPSHGAASHLDSEAAAKAFGEMAAQSLKSLGGLSLPFPSVAQMQLDYVEQATALWNQALHTAVPAQPSQPGQPGVAKAALKDRRFAAPDWVSSPANEFTAQLYLLNARTLMGLADQVQGDEKTRQRIRFAVQQWVDAAAPSNYLALNPEAQRKALETNGESLTLGLQHFWHDVQQGHVSQTDETLFEVGRNVATSEGAVVFENELFQLLEFKPLTPKVHERPMLFVPPCINKYYILDLQPDNSLIRHTVAQGHRVFVVSWRNPDDSLSKVTWDQYIEDAVIRAIDVVRDISGVDKINTLGFCVGGTLLSTALAVLAGRGEKPAASVTLLTTLLDFSDTGILDVFIDEAMVQMREVTIGPDSPNGGGLLKGKELASTFSALRPNDLVWNYVVGNYLKGEAPPAFDLLYWNSDSTNLPGPMFCWYLRQTYLENNLMKPGGVSVSGEPVDLSMIDAPVYVFGSREDHIVPWEAAYRNTQVLTGSRRKVRFVLGASGHIAGVINPPSKNKRSYWTGGTAAVPADPTVWLDNAEEHPGSWWTDWSAWLAAQAGRHIAAPQTPGSRQHPVIEAAPGRYVRQKA